MCLPELSLRLAEALESKDETTAKNLFKLIKKNVKIPNMNTVYEISQLNRACLAVYQWGLERFSPKHEVHLWPQTEEGLLVENVTDVGPACYLVSDQRSVGELACHFLEHTAR